MYQIELSQKAEKDLRKLRKEAVFSRIVSSIQLLAINPYPRQLKKLKNYQQADYRLRIGDYRVLYSIDPVRKVIVIVGVFHRQHGY